MINPILKKQIDNADVVSFDVFDTLITRKCLRPTDVFDFAYSFYAKQTALPLFPATVSTYRLMAEQEARKISGTKEVTLDQIYKNLNVVLNLRQEELETLKNYEIKFEEILTLPLKSGLEAVNYARTIGKRVIYISDMYLPKKVVLELLNKNGYQVEDNELFVSSDLGLTKRCGDLYDFVKKSYGIKLKYLHIGDSYKTDVEMAKLHKMEAAGVTNLNDNFISNSVKYWVFQPNSVYYDRSSTLITGLFARKDSTDDSFSDGSVNGLGYFCLGPLMYGFLEWLGKEVEQSRLEKVLFLARDGYLMHANFNLFSKVPSEYFYCSRKSLLLPLIHKLKSTAFVGMLNFKGTGESFIKNQLGISLTKDQYIALESLVDLKAEFSNTFEGAKIVSTILNYLKDEIKKKAELEYEAFIKYARKVIGRAKTVAIVDHGCSGSLAYFLSILLKDIGVKTEGFNVLLNNVSRSYCIIPHDLKIKGYFDEENSSNYVNVLFSHLPVMELLFSSPDPQLSKYVLAEGEDVNLIFGGVSSQKRKVFYESLKDGVSSFIKDYKLICNSLPFTLQLPRQVSSSMMVSYLTRPTKRDLTPWTGVIFENKFSGWNDQSVLESKSFRKFWPELSQVEANENKIK